MRRNTRRCLLARHRKPARELRPAPGPPGREALGFYRQTRWCRVFAGVARVRALGTLGLAIVVLHDGPGAPGHMASVARGHANPCRV